MPRYTPHETTIIDLQARGLLDESKQLTPAGHEWTRALIARIDDQTATNSAKVMGEWEREQAYVRALNEDTAD
jgi:hypothetical protein